MNIVRILPIIADDGKPLWQMPHFTAPFLKPQTVYEFSTALVKNDCPLRIQSAQVYFFQASEPKRVYLSKLLNPDSFA